MCKGYFNPVHCVSITFESILHPPSLPATLEQGVGWTELMKILGSKTNYWRDGIIG